METVSFIFDLSNDVNFSNNPSLFKVPTMRLIDELIAVADNVLIIVNVFLVGSFFTIITPPRIVFIVVNSILF